MFLPHLHVHLQWRKDVGLTHQKRPLYIVASCVHHTNVAASGKGLLLLECSPCQIA
ncbi:hypothetical protein HanRHA438_Chr04g0189991 [Helianthus annuus]|nr:hypothetical protein HanRHA438_Chr04g0189991 [Helianthus annuus]